MNSKNELTISKKNGFAHELINERNEKSLFLVLLLPWLAHLFVSFVATSHGLVVLLFSKRIEETFLNFAIVYMQGKVGYITLVSLINLAFDLIILFILMLQKNKFYINLLKVFLFLLVGYCSAAIAFVLGSEKSEVELIKNVLGSAVVLSSSYYVFFRFFPKKYIEILSGYWGIYIFREIQLLSKNKNSPKDEKAIKNRLRLYIYSLLSNSISSIKEKDLILLIQKWRLLDMGEGSKIKTTSTDFLDYLRLRFNFQTLDFATTDFNNQNLWGRFLMFLDQMLSFTVFSSAFYPDVSDLLYRALHPATKNNYSALSLSEDKNFKKIIKFHLSQAREADIISARQKIYIFIAISFVYLISPTALFFINFRNDGLWFEGDRFLFLLVQYFSTTLFVLFFVQYMQQKYRIAGMGVYIRGKFFGYFMNSVIFLIFLITAIVSNDVAYKYVSTVFFEELDLILICISLLQLFFLFLFLKPPSELRNPTIATSLLVRELMSLRYYILGYQTMHNRRKIARHIYFSKKYFGYIEKSLIYSRYDSKPQISQLRNYFVSVGAYLDRLSSDLKLGVLSNRDKLVAEIETVIYLVAIEKLGDIPNYVPEIKSDLGAKSVQPVQLNNLEKMIQVFDTSWFIRTVFLLLIFIIINLFNPSLWQYIQNFSSLYGILPP